jgi:hypothetical protein
MELIFTPEAKLSCPLKIADIPYTIAQIFWCGAALENTTSDSA